MSVPVLGLGLGSSLYYFYPVVESKKGALLTQTILVQIAMASIFFICVLCLDNIILSFCGPNAALIRSSILEIALLAVFLFLSSMIEHIFILEKKAILNFFYLVAETIIRASLVLSVALFTRDIDLVVKCLTLFYLIRFIFLILYLAYNYRDEIGFNVSLLKEQLRYALPFGGALIVSQIGQRMDKLIVSARLGITQFATYSVATVFKIPLIDMYFDSIFSVVLPKMSTFAYQQDTFGVAGLIKKILKKTIPITISLVLFFEIFSEQIIFLMFTEKYLDAVNLFRIALLTLIPRMFGRGLILRAYKKTHVQFKIALVQLLIALVFGILFVTLFGLPGAILSYFIAVSFSYYLTIRVEADLLDISLKERINYNMIKKVLKGCIMPCTCSSTILLFKNHMHPVCILAIGTLIYYPLLLIFYHNSNIINLNINGLNIKKHWDMVFK